MVFILSLFSASCPAMQPLSFFFFLYSKLLYLFFQRYRLVVFLGVLLIYALCSMESIPGIAFHCQLQCDSSFSPYSAPALVLVDKKYSPHVFSFLYFFFPRYLVRSLFNDFIAACCCLSGRFYPYSVSIYRIRKWVTFGVVFPSFELVSHFF